MNHSRPKTCYIAIASLLSLASLSAVGGQSYGPYAGASATLGFVNYDQVDRPKGYQAFAGYQFNSPLFAEASYLDGGNANLKPLSGATRGVDLSYEGYSAGLGIAQVFRDEQVRLWVLGSYYDGDSNLDYPAGSVPREPARTARITTSATGASLAVGGDFNIARYFGIRTRIERMFEIKDGADAQDLTLISVGVYFSFPVHDAPRGERSRVRMVPLSQQASPYVYRQPPVSCPRGPARVKVSHPLFNQPKSNSAYDQTAPAGTSVMVIDTLDNWCLADVEGIKGWLPAENIKSEAGQ